MEAQCENVPNTNEAHVGSVMEEELFLWNNPGKNVISGVFGGSLLWAQQLSDW